MTDASPLDVAYAKILHYLHARRAHRPMWMTVGPKELPTPIAVPRANAAPTPEAIRRRFK